MIDLVYPLGESSWSHNELRYSLRSVQKYARVRRVFIAGVCPTWARGVIHIPVPLGGGTVAGQLRALREVVKDPRLGEELVYMNDDIYLLDRPRWTHQHYLAQRPVRDKYFKGCFDRAVELLASNGIGPARDYELHTPMMMTKEGLELVLDMITAPAAFRTVYGNLYPDAEPRAMADVKLRGSDRPDPSWWCFSTDDSIVRQEDFQKWMAERYPGPSRWEVRP